MKEDTLSKDIEAAVDSAMAGNASEPALSGDGAPSGEAAKPENGKPVGGTPARDESGKFTAKAEAPKVAPKDAPKLAQPGTAKADVKPVEQAVSPAVPPPAHWKGNGKVEWNRLPQHVQKEISDDFAQTDKTSSELQGYRSAIGEQRSQVLAAQYGSVENGIKSILAGADMANQNPGGFILWLAQRSGIDLAQLVQGGAQGQQPAQQPHPLEREIIQLRNQLQQLQQSTQQSMLAPIDAEITRFRNDPANPYYNDVEGDIVALLKGGFVKGSNPSERLKNAYEAAVWARADIRESLLNNERSRVLDMNAAKVEQAKRAAGSLTGSPAGGKAPEDGPKRNLDDAVRASVEYALSRAS